MRYDIAVIGNDPAAADMAIIAAAAGQRTVAVFPEVCHSSWMKAQALKRVIMDVLAGRTPERARLFRSVASPGLIRQLLLKSLAEEVADAMSMLQRNGVDVLSGESRFQSANELTVSSGIDCSRVSIRAGAIVLGTGMRRASLHRTLGLIPYQTAETLLEMPSMPETLRIVGGGDFGAGLAALFSLFGVSSEFLPDEAADSAMSELMAESGVRVTESQPELTYPLHVSGRRCDRNSLRDVAVDCRRRLGFTRHLNLAAIGVEPDENGQLWCAANFETWCPGVFGIGEVVGYGPDTELTPALQARKILNRIHHRIPRPHFLNAFRNQVRQTALYL